MNNKALFTGSFSDEQIECKVQQKSGRSISPELEKIVQANWSQIKQRAKLEGKNIWDQSVHRLEGFKVENTECVLYFSTIPFSIRWAMNKYTDILLDLGPEYYPMGAYSSIFVESSDGKFIFVEKSDKYLSRRKISFIGGVFNKAKRKSIEHNGLCESAMAEIREELGIRKNFNDDLRLIGAFINQTCNTCFVLYCRIGLTEAEIKSLFEENHDDEVDKLIFVTRESLPTFVTEIVGMNETIMQIFNLFEP